MPSWTRQLIRLITVRYWIALVLIALFVTASFVVLHAAIERERGGFEFVRLSAEQRVSSQRICFLAHALVDATDDEDQQYYRSTLRRALRDMSRRHEILSLRAQPKRIPQEMRKILHDIYFGGPQPFNDQVDNFLKNAGIVAETEQNGLSHTMPELMKVNYAGSRQIMQTHNMIFGLLKKEAQGAVDRILKFGTVLWILTLVLLAVEVPLIFRPMARRAARSLNIMELARRRAKRDAAAARTARECQASFMRTMSHELRTPLNAILGMTQLMTMGKQPRKWTEYVDDIHQAGRHLLDLINDILEFSRLDAGQVLIEEGGTYLRELMEHTVSLLRPLAAEKDLELDLQMDRTLAENYWADGPRIRQILVNLIGNAIKFTNSGGITVRVIYAGAAGAEGDLVRFEVRDTGIGVAPSVRDRIFEEFQQADASLARKYGGSGLGLAISSRLVRLMDGTIGVESAEGDGSVFWFELPLKRMTARLLHEQKEPFSLERALANSRLDVLLIQRDTAARKALTNALRNQGHHVRAAATAKDGLLEVMESPPDVILIDETLADNDGHSAIKVVRAIRALPGPAAGVFIIALGSDDDGKGIENIMEAGADISLDQSLEPGLLHRYLTEFADGPVRVRSA